VFIAWTVENNKIVWTGSFPPEIQTRDSLNTKQIIYYYNITFNIKYNSLQEGHKYFSVNFHTGQKLK
jgi:hypothetical protein